MKINKDFYNDLPGMVCIMLDKMITQYKTEPWFEKAWQEYRQHVKSSGIDNMKMPGFVFNKYIKHSMGGGLTLMTNFKMVDEELYHHGILGMKWGVRRYQNPDGSLTAEGKRRYRMDSSGNYVKRSRKEMKAYDKKVKQLAAAQKAKKLKSPRNKDIKEMTDKQLEKYITRMTNEKRAIELRNDVNRLDPKPLSKGEQFTKYFVDKVVNPFVQQQGKQILDKIITEAMKKDKEPDKYAQAKKDAEYYKNLNTIEQQKKQMEKNKNNNDGNKNQKDSGNKDKKSQESKAQKAKEFMSQFMMPDDDDSNSSSSSKPKTEFVKDSGHSERYKEPRSNNDKGPDVVDAVFTVKNQDSVNDFMSSFYTAAVPALTYDPKRIW